jgi:long-chain acyl-CoA synthetase
MVLQWLSRAARSWPDKPALVQGGRVVTYRQWLQAADALARQLLDGGLGPGRTVATQMGNSIECAIALAAVTRTGASNLVLDPALKAVEVSRYCQRTGASAVLWPSAAAGGMPSLGLPLFAVPAFETLLPEARGSQAALLADAPPASDWNVFLLLSSGTSGPPKIVPKTAAQAEAAVQVFRGTLPYRDTDRVLGVLPFFHSFGLFNVLLASMAAGATLVLERFSPRETADAVERHSITVLPVTPLMLRLLCETEFHARPDFSSVRLAVSAGSALSQGVVRGMREKFGVGIAQSYGTTESGPIALARPEHPIDKPGWVGTLYAGLTVEIRDPSRAPLGPNRQGEIAVKSPANASGYLDGPEASAEAFRGEWVLTGDVGYKDDAGHLYALGRKRRMVNVAGKKVSPAEVEACLRSHPSVGEALVFGEPTSNGTERVKAMVVLTGQASERQIQEYCAARLADFKIPRQIVFVEDLAGGPMGKPQDTKQVGL